MSGVVQIKNANAESTGMVLVDTSIWVGHIRFGDLRLAELLNQGRVFMHEMVLGEIACGSLQEQTAGCSLQEQ